MKIRDSILSQYSARQYLFYYGWILWMKMTDESKDKTQFQTMSNLCKCRAHWF